MLILDGTLSNTNISYNVHYLDIRGDHSLSRQGCAVGQVPYIEHCTVYSVKYTVYSIQCKVYSVQYTVQSIQCAVHNVNCTLTDVQGSVRIVHCAVHNVHFTINIIDCTEHNLTVQYSTYIN